MSRKRKATNRELQEMIETNEQMIQQNQNILNAIIGELNGVAGLIVTHLTEEGKMQRIDCPNCGHTNNHALLEDFPSNGLCLSCGVSFLDEEE